MPRRCSSRRSFSSKSTGRIDPSDRRRTLYCGFGYLGDALDDLEAPRPCGFEAGADFDARSGAHARIVRPCHTVWQGRHGSWQAAAPIGLLASARVPTPYPTLRIERKCWSAGDRVVVGIDEVGRGSWAGPVTVAAVVPGDEHLSGVRDSKLLSPAEREVSARRVRGWARGIGVGHASHTECDELGMTEALRRAANRALAMLAAQGFEPDRIVLDGKHDYLGMPRTVRTIVKADQTVLSVAAASVVAKVTRDAMMAEEAEHFPAYGFDSNRGYPAPVHKCALAGYGPSLDPPPFVDLHGVRPVGRGVALRARAATLPVLTAPVLPEPRSGRRSKTHAATLADHDLRALFAADPDRADRMQVDAAGWHLDYAKQRVDRETMQLLVAAGRSAGWRARVDAMFAGEHVNVTEDRPVLHVALRMPAGSSLVVDGVDVVGAGARRARQDEHVRASRSGRDVAGPHRPARSATS